MDRKAGGRTFAASTMLSNAITRPDAAARANDYEDADRVFQSNLNIQQRLFLQVLMTDAGYWNAVPNEYLSHRLFASIQNFQANNGFQPNGVLTGNQVNRLGSIAFPTLNLWGWKSLAPRPRRHHLGALGRGASPSTEAGSWRNTAIFNSSVAEISHKGKM